MLYRIFLFLFIYAYINSAYSIPVITFFLRPCLNCPAHLSNDKLQKVFCNPGKISKKILDAKFTTPGYLQGIFASYWGYVQAPNRNGQIIFPRKQKTASIKVLVTQRIKPIMMIGRTIHHWELDSSVPASFYQYTQTIDPHTKKYSWHVCQIDLPANNIIELDTITLFAKPSHIFIPIGNFKSEKSPHLYLPDIYVKKEINTVIRSLWVLKIKNFFDLIPAEMQKISPVYFSRQILP